MARAEKAWREALHAQTIADMVASYSRDTSPELQQQSGQWLAGRMRRAIERSGRGQAGERHKVILPNEA